MSRDTEIRGEPSELAAVSAWLHDTVRPGASGLADSAYTVRSRAGSAWQAPAADAFHTELTRLGESADATSSAARAMATEVDGLVAALRSAQEDARRAREVARTGGLTVTGTVIHPPGPAPVDIPVRGPGVTGTQAAGSGGADTDAHDEKVTAWEEANRIADGAEQAWQDAIANIAKSWESHNDSMTSLLRSTFQGGAQGAMEARAARWYRDAATTYEEQSRVWREIADSYVQDGRFVGSDADDLYRALDTADDLDDLSSSATNAADDVKASRAGTNIGRGFLALDVLATGYNIHADMQAGESTTQAAASNGGALLASIGAGAATGAAVGTLVPVPGVGTAAGAIVGAGVGIVTSGAIDSMFENGVDSLGDVGNALGDGWEELTDTGEAIGDMAGDATDTVTDAAGDAVDAVGDGLSDAWNSVF